jgi:hypothetical protein
LTVALSCPSCLREKGQAITHAHDLDCHGDPDAVAVMVKPDAQQAIALIDQWLADGSGHDEAVWPVIEKALRRRGQQADPTRKRPPAYRPMLPAAWRLEIERRGLDIRQIVAEALQINESDYHGWTPTTSTEPVAFSRPKNYGPNALAEFENDGGEVEIRAIETDAALDQFLDIVEERNVAICRSMTTALQGYEVI